MFTDELNQHIGSQVQVVTSTQTVSGTLLAASDAAVTVRSSSYPGYNGAEDVTIRTDTISYVRLFV